jgi:Flp pilus assembly protein TadB
MLGLAGLLTWLSMLTALADGSSRSLRRLDEEAAGHQSRLTLDGLVESWPGRTALCVVATMAALWVFLGAPAAGLGLPAGVALSWWISRLEPPSVTRRRAELDRDLPVAAELLAACALVGRPPVQSLPVVSSAVGGALGAELGAISARLELGCEPEVEWRRLCEHPQLSALGRAMLRTVESGAPLVDSLTRLAEDRRRQQRTDAQLKARAVGVRAAGPLALCFLPAFMLIGVVPTVAGTFQALLS